MEEDGRTDEQMMRDEVGDRDYREADTGGVQKGIGSLWRPWNIRCHPNRGGGLGGS